MKVCLFVCLFLFLAVPQRPRPSEIAPRYAPTGAPAPHPETGTATLSIEAGLVYKDGDAKPVARANFYLLDDDLVTILGKAGAKLPPEMDSGDRAKDLIHTFAVAQQIKGVSEYTGFRLTAERAIAAHLLKAAVTDFNGKATFEPVRTGPAFIVGTVQTQRRGYVVWNSKLDLKPGKNSLVLDQGNAAYVK